MIQLKHPLTLAVLAAIALPSHAFAENTDTDTVIITASRTAETYNDALASVTVITRQDIENSQARSVEELLSGHTGIDITQRGGYGKNSSIFMRGTKTGHVLFLVDGVKLASATLGLTSFQFLPLAQIERIEIVRGPRSSLYGSEAIGGVIQIFTRKGSQDYHTQATVGAGSENQQEASISTSGSLANTRYSLSLSSQRTDGIDARNDTETDDDGYENNSVALSLSHALTDKTEIEANVLHAEGETEYDGTYSNNSDFVQQAASVKLRHGFTEAWQSTLVVGSSKDEDQGYHQSEFKYRFTTKHDEINWQNDLAINDNNLLTLGADYQNDDIGNDNGYTKEERDNQGLFAQHQATMGKHDVTLSLRNDDNEAFGSHNTGGIAWGYKFDKTRVYASYGTAFKAPTLGDLYYPFGGNANLKPEESVSYEIGARTHYSWGSVETNLYQTDIDNLIAWACTANCNDADFFNDVWQPTNIDKAEIQGAEIIVNTQLFSWQTRLELSWVDPKDAKTGNTLLLRAKQTAKLDLERQFDALTLGFSVLTQSARYTDASNTDELGGYGIVDIRAGWAVNKQWQLKARINNVADKAYETSEQYNSPGRTFFAGVSYDIK